MLNPFCVCVYLLSDEAIKISRTRKSDSSFIDYNNREKNSTNKNQKYNKLILSLLQIRIGKQPS